MTSSFVTSKESSLTSVFLSIVIKPPPEEKSVGRSPSPPPLPAAVHLISETVQSWIRAGDLKRWIQWHAPLLTEDGKGLKRIFNTIVSGNLLRFYAGAKYSLISLLENVTWVTNTVHSYYIFTTTAKQIPLKRSHHHAVMLYSNWSSSKTNNVPCNSTLPGHHWLVYVYSGHRWQRWECWKRKDFKAQKGKRKKTQSEYTLQVDTPAYSICTDM